MVATSTGLEKSLTKSQSLGQVYSHQTRLILVLSEVSSGQMIVFVTEDLKLEIFGVGHVDMIIPLEETIVGQISQI